MTRSSKKQEIEITIKPDGQVEFHLEGFGKACDDYIKILKDTLNAKIQSTRYTSEYYADTTTIGIQNRSKY